jgi:hypothetical protein
MDAFLDALRQRDQTRFLASFSRTAPFRYESTLVGPAQFTDVSFDQLQADFQKRTGWYESMFGLDDEDCFRDWAVGDEGQSWTKSGANRFVRRRVDDKDSVYVEWRKEGASWVVSVIAEPSA